MMLWMMMMMMMMVVVVVEAEAEGLHTDTAVMLLGVAIKAGEVKQMAAC